MIVTSLEQPTYFSALAVHPMTSDTIHDPPPIPTMWIFLNDAFLSIVSDKDNPLNPNLLIRARRAGDIERVFPAANVSATPSADYAFRAWVPRDNVSGALTDRIAHLSYPNFKNSIADSSYHDACSEIWFTLREYQEIDKVS